MRSRRRRTCCAALLGAALAGVVSMAPPAGAAAAAPARRELVVFAAASLREVFEGLARELERARPGLTVALNLAGSQELRLQLEQGAGADLFASADLKQIDALARAGLVEAPRPFAQSEPVLVVPRDNPAGLRAFADLPRARRLVIGTPEVPIGAYTRHILAKAGAALGGSFTADVSARVASLELNTRQVLAKVALGEADAGIVYRTDARAAAGKVATIAIPPAFNVTALYPVAIVKATRQRGDAEAFVALLLGPAGRARLAQAGFSAPRGPSADR